MELRECKRYFQREKAKRNCREKIERTKEKVEPMKTELSDFVTSYGYQNVRAFLVEYEKSRSRIYVVQTRGQ